MLAALLVRYETNPYPITVARSSPIYGTLQCQAAHGSNMDASLRKTIVKSVKSKKAMKKLEEMVAKDLTLRSLVGTTQAIDLISGGVKTNALPEQAWAVVNHRIATQRFVSSFRQTPIVHIAHGEASAPLARSRNTIPPFLNIWRRSSISRTPRSAKRCSPALGQSLGLSQSATHGELLSILRPSHLRMERPLSSCLARSKRRSMPIENPITLKRFMLLQVS